MTETVKRIPRFYKPRDYQKAAWERRLSGRYDYYFKLLSRRAGKDTDDIQFALYSAWLHPGTQTAYIGEDNKWIRRNIWEKYLDGRRHWDNYPDDILEVKETAQQVLMHNNPEDKAPAIVQFIGMKENESLVGSSYDGFYVSELSKFKRNSFDYIPPIWDENIKAGKNLGINFNFTPRGLSNIAADFLRTYTGQESPDDWGGEHIMPGFTTFVEILTARDAGIFTDEELEQIRDRYVRAHGNDNRFRQEYMCEFLAVNAGLVFPAIEQLRKEGRYHAFNIDTSYPVYTAWDVSSKDKESDWTSAIVFQHHNGQTFIYDWYEDNRKAVVECVQELASREYFHRIRQSVLPWDGDRSGSRHSPLEECRSQFPNIIWRTLERTYQVDGLNRVRKLFPNLHINSEKCAWVMECLESWEYRELTSAQDWAAKPKHDRYSHIGDAIRYMADMIEQIPYIRQNDGLPQQMPASYRAWDLTEEDEDEYAGLPIGMRPSRLSQKRRDDGGFEGWLKPERRPVDPRSFQTSTQPYA